MKPFIHRLSFLLLARLIVILLLTTATTIVSAQSFNAGALVPAQYLLLLDDAVRYSVLNDTGITWGGDYPSGNNADCNSNIADPQDCNQGRDFTHNDDSDGHAGFSFTKLDANGNALSADADSWSCVKDKVTGLIWEVKTDDGGIHDKDNTYRWGGITHLGTGYGTYNDDWDTLVNGSNNASFCGFSDWRVPTVNELENLASLDRINPAIDSNYFPNTLSSSFWSASPSANNSGDAWSVFFNYGLSFSYDRSNYRFVRLVRSGQ